MNGQLISSIIYADEMVLMSPSSTELCQLLHECEQFGTRHDVKYNVKKIVFRISVSTALRHVVSYKYLGYHVTDYLSDDNDINRRYRMLHVQRTV